MDELSFSSVLFATFDTRLDCRAAFGLIAASMCLRSLLADRNADRCVWSMMQAIRSRLRAAVDWRKLWPFVSARPRVSHQRVHLALANRAMCGPAPARFWSPSA